MGSQHSKTMTLFQAIILAVVEGLTEYLPISSTGHLVITASFMGVASDHFTKDFIIAIQLGAIISVLALYWRRFLASRAIYLKLMIAFFPAALLGLMIKKKIDLLLDNQTVVATMTLLGGVLLLFVDRFFKRQEDELRLSGRGDIDTLSFTRAGVIGLVQCLAFLPGTSRSAASILGGLGAKLTRESAAEFSFLLAVPTLAAATVYKLSHIYQNIEPGQVSLLLIGNVVSFIVGAITIKTFLRFLTRNGFFWFGVYRIILGALILGLLFSGYRLESL
jgi:undecaprenyl-diphosphatase